jgi:hypothetical protein
MCTVYVLYGDRACTIEFEARAFQGQHDPEPVLMHYKGVSSLHAYVLLVYPSYRHEV